MLTLTGDNIESNGGTDKENSILTYLMNYAMKTKPLFSSIGQQLGIHDKAKQAYSRHVTQNTVVQFYSIEVCNWKVKVNLMILMPSFLSCH